MAVASRNKEMRKLLGLTDKQCCLCFQESELKHSHVVPKFVYSWMKETSATGYLRGGHEPEDRLQDGIKEYLLCGSCEGIFSKFEQKFSSIVFYPYVEKELDKNGVAQSVFQCFDYSDWLIKFCLSIQYRSALVTTPVVDASQESMEYILTEIKKWRLFLLGESQDSGITRSNLIFLQNLAYGQGNIPGLHPKAASYSLRAIDTTPVFNDKEIAFWFSKLGPMVFITNFEPTTCTDMKETQLRMKGNFQTATSIRNTLVSYFLLKKRPQEVYDHILPSEKVENRATKAYQKNPERVASSMTVVAQQADILMRQKTATSPKSDN